MTRRPAPPDPAPAIPTEETTLVSVDAPHFNAGLILTADLCTEAAPILAWAIGKRRDFLRQYFARKGWKAIVVPWQPRQ